MKRGMVVRQPQSLNRSYQFELANGRQMPDTPTAHTAGILHDMRNFVMVISLNSSMLSASISTEHTNLLAGITQASEYLESLINDLQSVTLQSQHSLRPADLDATLGQVAAFARASHPSVRFLLPARSGITVQIEQTQLLRCLLNLSSNAAEAAADSSSTERLVEFKITRSAESLTILVSDSGDGFPQEDPSRAFDAFVSRRPNPSGHSGLGLYVVRSIVEQAGGRVTTSRADARTEVRVELPIRIAHSSKPARVT